MSLRKRTLIALGALWLALPALAQEPKPVAKPGTLGFSDDRLDRITSTFQGYVDQGKLPGAVILIARDDKVAYYKAIGYRDREKKIAMTTDSIFRLASMTKPIVSLGAMMLAEEGKLDLTAPVSTYLPEFKDLKVAVEHKDPATGKTETTQEPQARPMIVQDLLRHTAGLVYGPPIGTGPVAQAYQEAKVSDRETTLAEMVTKLSKIPLAFQPGEAWEYSMAVDVLGRVIEVASGEALDQFIERRVTAPLGMVSTGFYTKDADKDRIAQPQIDPATGKAPAYFDPSHKPKLFSGGGGAVGTAADYLRLCEMFLHGGALGTTRLVAPSTVALMTSNALKPDIGYGPTGRRFGDIAPTPAAGQGFGLGFAVRTNAGGNMLPGSVGSFYWTGAYGTTFYIDPKLKLILIMMIQSPLTDSAQYRHVVHALAYQALTSP